MRLPRGWGRCMQAAAQALVDWYVATYGARRARRYLGGCERRGLVLPDKSGASKGDRRRKET